MPDMVVLREGASQPWSLSDRVASCLDYLREVLAKLPE